VKPAAKKAKVRKNRDGSTCAAVEQTTVKHDAEIYRMRHEDGRTWLAIAETLGLIPATAGDTSDGKWGSVHVWNAHVAWCAAIGETPVRSLARGRYARRDDVAVRPRPSAGGKGQAWTPAYSEGATLKALRSHEGGKVHWRSGAGVTSAACAKVTSLRNGALNFYEAVDQGHRQGRRQAAHGAVADLVKSA
jgi:hypothetical protein